MQTHLFSQFSPGNFDVEVFPGNYSSARQRWLTELECLSGGYQHVPYPSLGIGAAGENLITDTAWVGNAQADNVLVLIGGTHGIEGFAGSAVQIDLLQALAAGELQLPEQTAILFIHALTPWGYSWLRRCDADGVDLNRNAIDFNQPLPENPGYQQLRDLIFSTDVEARQAGFAEYARQHGREALEIAISGGQYQDPAGPFYGGKTSAYGRMVCAALIRKYKLAQRNLAVVDLHTGLGSYGYGEIICDHQPDSAGAKMAQQWYGDAVTLPYAGTSSSVPKLGLLDYAWHAVMNDRSCYITLEFGTYSTMHLFEILLRDHQLWAEPGNDAERKAHSQVMRRHFCPHDNAWQEMVLFRARQVVRQALVGLSAVD